MQTLHLIEKVCIKSACRLADFSKVCIVCKTQTFFEKVCTKSAQSLQSLHVFCNWSARIPGFFLGKTPCIEKCRLIAHLMQNYADYMQT